LYLLKLLVKGAHLSWAHSLRPQLQGMHVSEWEIDKRDEAGT